MLTKKWGMESMIKAALFDFDGTLLNRDESVKKFIGIQYDRLYEKIGHIQKVRYISRFIQLDNHGYTWKDKVYEQLVNEFEIEAITWEELLQDYLTEFQHSCVAFPNLIEMLERLKASGLKLAIITNGFGKFQMDNIKALKIENYFDAILVSEWEGMKKPDVRIFNRALETLKVSPIECIFIGDHPSNDVKAAQNAGMKGIWKKNVLAESIEADAIIDDLFELGEVIERFNK